MSTALRPQPKQEEFLSTQADIAIGGGAAGGGKTLALLMEGARHKENKHFTPTILRRTSTDLKKQGGIWDESEKIYPYQGARGSPSALRWRFPSGMKLQMGHIEYEKDLESWKSAQLGMIGFEELTQFTEKMFWYMLSRNRSTSGITPYVRATTNPDPDSFVRPLIDWWIGDDGYAIPERSGKLRYFGRDGDDLIWGDDPYQVSAKVPMLQGKEHLIKSLTFIPFKLTDNQALLDIDPGYEGNLMSLGLVEREQLLSGNWDIRPAAGLYFKREWLAGRMLDAPFECDCWCRGWDLAATTEEENKDADRTASWYMGVKLLGGKKKKYCVAHASAFRETPHGVEAAMLRQAEGDQKGHWIRIPQDPGQSGKSQASSLISMLSGFNVKKKVQSGKKTTRFSPFSAQLEAGNVYFVKGDWNEQVFKELESFPSKKVHDDLVDAASESFDLLRRYKPFTAY